MDFFRKRGIKQKLFLIETKYVDDVLSLQLQR